MRRTDFIYSSFNVRSYSRGGGGSLNVVMMLFLFFIGP